MLSRVADSLYWMSRYLERAENTVRQLDVTLSLLLDISDISPETRWDRLTLSLGCTDAIAWNGDIDAMARLLIFSADNPASILCCLDAARENAQQVREEISSEQWQRLNRLYHQMHSPQTHIQSRASISDVLTAVIDGIHLFKGVSDTTMIHGDGWQFIRLGRYLERAYSTATLLEVHHENLFHTSETEQTGYRYLEMVGLLRCCTSFEACCQVYTADISPERVLEFLLLNRDFPHALRYAIDGIRNSLEAIEASGARRAPETLHSAVGRLQSMLRYSTIEEILGGDTGAFLHSIRAQCQHIHEVLYSYYMQYSVQAALAV